MRRNLVALLLLAVTAEPASAWCGSIGGGGGGGYDGGSGGGGSGGSGADPGGDPGGDGPDDDDGEPQYLFVEQPDGTLRVTCSGSGCAGPRFYRSTGTR